MHRLHLCPGDAAVQSVLAGITAANGAVSDIDLGHLSGDFTPDLAARIDRAMVEAGTGAEPAPVYVIVRPNEPGFRGLITPEIDNNSRDQRRLLKAK